MPPEESTTPDAEQLLPPAEWPSQGKLVLRDVKLTYRPGLQPALRGVTCSIQAGEKIGIVGRTGAGKSSLTLAILRMADQVSGLVEIDGVDTSQISLNTLRRRVAIIPQGEHASPRPLHSAFSPLIPLLLVEATMFAGDIRHNLDPLNANSDDVLSAALAEVGLVDVVKDAGGLDGLVSEDGANVG